jgi:hypothetical protein
MRRVLLAFGLLLLGACGAVTTPPDSGLPELPRDDAPRARVALAAGSVLLDGDDFVAKSENASDSGNMLQLDAGPGELSWGLYRLGGVAADYQPTRVTVTQADPPGEFWLALGNYQDNRWEFQATPVSAATGQFSIADYTRYASGAGNLYIAVVTTDASAGIESVEILVDDTRTIGAPANLQGTAGDGSAQLTWDAYSDALATELHIYQATAADMSGAVLAATVAADAVAHEVTGLTNGTTYYFALRGATGANESADSNIVSVTPQASVPFEVGGLWGRLGNTADNGGYTANSGPADFSTFQSVTLSTDSKDNRTSPVIDVDGNVFALSSDGHLVSYSHDLASLRFDADIAADAQLGGGYLAPPHAPCLDAQGNVYCVVVAAGSEAHLVSYTNDGTYRWKQALGPITPDNDVTYPSPNIVPGQGIFAVGDEFQIPRLFDAGGTQVWSRPDYFELYAFHTEPAIGAAGNIEVPIDFIGFAVGQPPHWLQLDPADSGNIVNRHQEFGFSTNRHGGVALPDSLHVYGEQSSQTAYLVDTTSGTAVDSHIFFSGIPAGSARNAAGDTVFMLMDPVSNPGAAELRFLALDPDNPDPAARLSERYNLALRFPGNVHSKPAVDGNGDIYCAIDGGYLYRVRYDPAQPIGGGNPEIVASGQLDAADTYWFNSPALGDGTLYIVSEQNVLYRVGPTL